MSLEKPRTILVAVDGSQHSNYAFKWALDNIVRPRDTILLATTISGQADNKQSWCEVQFSQLANGKDTERAVRLHPVLTLCAGEEPRRKHDAIVHFRTRQSRRAWKVCVAAW